MSSPRVGHDRAPRPSRTLATTAIPHRRAPSSVRGRGATLAWAARLATIQYRIARGGGGRIINISSVAGKKGRERFAAYCASKFAVIGFTQCLALELAPHGITVNAICPGLIDTERLYGIASGIKPADMTTEDYRDQMIREGRASIPLGRPDRGEDVARLAAFLASPESEYMTGLALNVAGGMVMH